MDWTSATYIRSVCAFGGETPDAHLFCLIINPEKKLSIGHANLFYHPRQHHPILLRDNNRRRTKTNAHTPKHRHPKGNANAQTNANAGPTRRYMGRTKNATIYIDILRLLLRHNHHCRRNSPTNKSAAKIDGPHARQIASTDAKGKTKTTIN